MRRTTTTRADLDNVAHLRGTEFARLRGRVESGQGHLHRLPTKADQGRWAGPPFPPARSELCLALLESLLARATSACHLGASGFATQVGRATELDGAAPVLHRRREGRVVLLARSEDLLDVARGRGRPAR